MNAGPNWPSPGFRTRWWLAAGAALIAGLAACVALSSRLSGLQSSADTDRTKTSDTRTQPAQATGAPPADFFVSERIRDNGFEAAVELFGRSVRNPRSLEDIRAAWDGLGYRLAEALERDLARTGLSRVERFDHLMRIAAYQLYEGEFLRASAALAEARSLLDVTSALDRNRLLTTVFAQGVAALRRAK